MESTDNEALTRLKGLDSALPVAGTINSLYTEVTTTIMTLDQQVGGVLRRHELEFLNHYKGAMYKLQKEMKILKEKANDEESKRRKLEKIESLANERDTLRTEAERLDKLCTKRKKLLDSWKCTAQELEGDQKFLKTQIEAACEQNSSLTQKLHTLQNKRPASPAAESLQCPSSRQESPPRPGRYYAQLHSRLSDTMSHLQSQLELEKRALNKLKATRTNYILEKGELEDIFLKSVEEVKLDIVSRKKDSAKLNRKGPPSKPTEVSLEDFKGLDKRKVMELFLNSEQVREFLYEKLFAQQPRSKSKLLRLPKDELRSYPEPVPPKMNSFTTSDH